MTDRCPRCTGDGGYHALVHRAGSCTEEYLACALCHGDGKISAEVAGWLKVGSDHRNARVAREESLRECARRLGVSAALVSAMETGRERPRFTQYCMACNADDPPHAPDCISAARFSAQEQSE
jgi:hypothetical protein